VERILQEHDFQGGFTLRNCDGAAFTITGRFENYFLCNQRVLLETNWLSHYRAIDFTRDEFVRLRISKFKIMDSS
jgi:hypothetical protein